MQLVNRLSSTQTTHTQFLRTCRVHSMPNPSLAHQAPLLQRTSSIFHPEVTFMVHPARPCHWPAEFSCVFSVFLTKLSGIFPQFVFGGLTGFSAHFQSEMNACRFSHFILNSTLITKLLSSSVHLKRVSHLWQKVFMYILKDVFCLTLPVPVCVCVFTVEKLPQAHYSKGKQC